MRFQGLILPVLTLCLLGGLAACESTKPVAHPASQMSTATPPTNTKCPVSGDDVDPHDPKLPTVVYQGKTYTCCCPDCVKEFNANPGKFTKAE